MGIINKLYFRSDVEQSFSTVLGTIINYDDSKTVLKLLLKLIAEKNRKVTPLVKEALSWLEKDERVEIKVRVERDISQGTQKDTKGYIDILVEIRRPNYESIYLLIENKIKADKFHGQQLKNYLKYIEEVCGNDNTLFVVISEIDFYELVRNTELENLKYDNSNEKDKVKIAQTLIENKKVVPISWSDIEKLLESAQSSKSVQDIMVNITKDFIKDIKGVQMDFKGFKKTEYYTVNNFFDFINDYYLFCQTLKSRTNGVKLVSTSGSDMNSIHYSEGREINDGYLSPLNTYDSAWSYGFSFSIGDTQNRYVQTDLSWLKKDNETRPVVTLYISDNEKIRGLLDSDKEYFELTTFIERFSEKDYEKELAKLIEKIKHLFSA